MEPNEKTEPETEKAAKEFYQMVYNSMREGQTKADIVWNITEGQDETVDRGPVLSAVEKVYNQIALKALKEKFLIGSFLPSIVGGLIAAIIAGGLWGAIVKQTEYEIGYTAIGIGWLCAWGVLLFNEGKKGKPAQIISCLSSLLGIVAGKYFLYYYFFKDMLVEQYGHNFASRVVFFSEEIYRGFFVFFIESFLRDGQGVMDLLWVALALGSAWKITKGMNLAQEVIDQTDVSYDSVTNPSLVKGVVLMTVGVTIIYLLFAQVSKVPEIQFGDITETDVKAVVKVMQRSELTQGYFEVLTPELVDEFSGMLNEFVTSVNEEKDFIDELNRIKTDYENYTVGLSQTEVPPGFNDNREQYPDLMQDVYRFILKEYYLYFYYNFYIVFFDKSYVLILTDETIHALDIINKSFFTG